MGMRKAAVLLLGVGLMLTACSSGEGADAGEEQTVPDLEIPAGSQELASGENGQEEDVPGEDSGEIDAKEEKEELVVIDPGHSAVVSGTKEPLGPGSSEQKAADTSGTSGVSTGLPEYELNLRVAQKLKTELENRGYTVILTRDTNDIQITNIQRAEIANDAGADAFVRIHANGIDDSSVKGAMTICITPDNPFYPELYSQSRALSDSIINEMCAAAGCENDGVWETDSMSGCNWSEVPVTIVEMGYMTNPEEDELMATDEYQNILAQGMANGIDDYFGYR
nr:N-acetylmuramoyl-L-alanine amidase [Mediterraneibacter glycyrrhizinilyticus]